MPVNAYTRPEAWVLKENGDCVFEYHQTPDNITKFTTSKECVFVSIRITSEQITYDQLIEETTSNISIDSTLMSIASGEGKITDEGGFFTVMFLFIIGFIIFASIERKKKK